MYAHRTLNIRASDREARATCGYSFTNQVGVCIIKGRICLFSAAPPMHSISMDMLSEIANGLRVAKEMAVEAVTLPTWLHWFYKESKMFSPT